MIYFIYMYRNNNNNSNNNYNNNNNNNNNSNNNKPSVLKQKKLAQVELKSKDMTRDANSSN